jgi:hypothetical protein
MWSKTACRLTPDVVKDGEPDVVKDGEPDVVKDGVSPDSCTARLFQCVANVLLMCC